MLAGPALITITSLANMETYTGLNWFSSCEQHDPLTPQIVRHFKSHPHVPKKVPAAVRWAWSTVMNNSWVLKPRRCGEKPATANAWSKAKPSPSSEAHLLFLHASDSHELPKERASEKEGKINKMKAALNSTDIKDLHCFMKVLNFSFGLFLCDWRDGFPEISLCSILSPAL